MGVSVGSETSGGIRQVDVAHNVHLGEGWSVALHVKTTPHRGNMVAGIAFRHNRVYNTSGFMRLESGYQGSAKRPLPLDYSPTVIRALSWISNHWEGGHTRSKWVCPSGYRTCHELLVENNTMPQGSGWRCANVGSVVVRGNAPEGLDACMRGVVERRPKRPKRERVVNAGRAKAKGGVRAQGSRRRHERGRRKRSHQAGKVEAAAAAVVGNGGCPFCQARDERWSGRHAVEDR